MAVYCTDFFATISLILGLIVFSFDVRLQLAYPDRIVFFMIFLTCFILLKVGRMAGQFAKPRSDPFETKDGVTLPSYQGDNINSDIFDEKSRLPDPERLERAYTQSAATLNLLRAFTSGGYASMQRVSQWNLDFTSHSEQGER